MMCLDIKHGERLGHYSGRIGKAMGLATQEIEELRKNAGTQFEPQIVDIFLDYLEGMQG